MAYTAFSANNVTVSNTAAETDIVSITVPANVLTADGDSMDFQSLAIFTNNMGSSQNLTLRIYVGGLEVYSDSSGTFATSAIARAVSMFGKVIRRTSTTAEMQINIIVGASNSATTGRGDFGSSATRIAAVAGTESFAWTFSSDTTFRISVQLQSASASLTYDHEWFLLQEAKGGFEDAQAFNAQTGTTYTLALSDAGRLVTLNNASAITLTVPPNASVAYATGTHIDLAQLGGGQVTIAPGSGVTLNSRNGLKLAGQYAVATLIKTDTNTWLVAGDTSI